MMDEIVVCRTLAPRIYEGGAPKGRGEKRNSPSQIRLRRAGFDSPLLKEGAKAPQPHFPDKLQLS